jgi:small ligand-binding sensory domain FIST
MTPVHSVSAHWPHGFDEAGLQRWAEDLRRRLPAERVSLGLVFMAPRLSRHAAAVLEILQVHARIPLLMGCSGASLVAGNEEVEDQPGLALGLFDLPGAELKAVHLTQREVEQDEDAAFWHQQTGVGPAVTNGWLVFADPFQMDCESWMRQWNEAYPGLPVVGGLASGDPGEQGTELYLNGEVFEEGAVALSVGGAVALASVVSQGCTPIGETWTLTRVERNLIHGIANRRAYDVLADTWNHLSESEKKKTQGNLFIGLVINEYLDDFHRGDFLIRNLLGADPASGIVAVGAFPRLGQTIQFQRRDAVAATEDMREMLARARRDHASGEIYGGCLCCCNGRGQSLFGEASHDARMIQTELGPFGLTGFFCNGEIGPVGKRSFLHGFTASLALFVQRHSDGQDDKER